MSDKSKARSKKTDRAVDLSTATPVPQGAPAMSDEESIETETSEPETSTDGTITIKVRSKKTGRAVEFTRNFGKDHDEAVALYGKSVVYDLYHAEAVIRSQGASRTTLDALGPDGTVRFTREEAVEAGLAYEPGQKRRRADSGVTRDKALQTLAKQVQLGEISLEDLVTRIQALQQEAQS